MIQWDESKKSTMHSGEWPINQNGMRKEGAGVFLDEVMLELALDE